MPLKYNDRTTKSFLFTPESKYNKIYKEIIDHILSIEVRLGMFHDIIKGQGLNISSFSDVLNIAIDKPHLVIN